MKRKIIISILGIIVFMTLLTGCNNVNRNKRNEKVEGKVNIIATLFPQYDFARQIVGDKGKVTMLMDPGVESHTYEPTPTDMININKADLFIYTGEFMEPWARTIIDGLDDDKIKILDVSQNIILDKEEHEEHISEENHDEEHEDHKHGYDPHIWTSPINAKVMVDNIVESLKEIDPDNSQYYESNGEQYKAKLDEVDGKFREVMNGATRKKIIFGDRFALHYLAKEYGIEWDAAFDSCSGESEPSAKVMSSLINEIKEENIPVVYYAELSNGKVAESLCEATGAKKLIFHSCHNVNKDEFEEGITYLELMNQNVENLELGVK